MLAPLPVVVLASLVFTTPPGPDHSTVDLGLRGCTVGPLTSSSSALPRRSSEATAAQVVVRKPIEAPADGPTTGPATAPIPTPAAAPDTPSAAAPARSDHAGDAPTCAASPCCVGEDDPERNAVFLFGGAFVRGSLGFALRSFREDSYDDRYIAALGYQRYFRSSRHWQLGWEFGFGQRFSNAYTMEFWTGPTLRHRGFKILDKVIVSSSVTPGVSAVTATMGEERVREQLHQGNGQCLFYLGGEIAMATVANPNVELFYRIHHRSGAAETLGRLHEGYNANCFGLRYRY